MAEKNEIPEIGAINALTGKDPRRLMRYSAILIPVPAVILSFLVADHLADLSGVRSPLRLIAGEARQWFPEIAIFGFILLYALSGLIVPQRVESAIAFHLYRLVGIGIYLVLFLDLGLRLLSATMRQNGLLVVMLGGLASFAVLLTVPMQIRSRLTKSRSLGSLRRYLDESRWTWKIQTPKDPVIDLESAQANRLLVILSKLHWIAPAAGIFMARNLADESVGLIFGGALLIVGLITANGVFSELGIVLQLNEWDKERGQRLRLV